MQHLWKTLNHLKKTLAGKSGKTNEGYLRKLLPEVAVHKWGKVFKSGLHKICGRQCLKNLKVYGLLKQTISLQNF